MIVADEMLVVSYGGGVNSKAMLVEWRERGGRRPDLILFADTGGERPETYADVCDFSAWLVSVGYPAVEIVRNSGRHGTLERECLTQHTLPSLAFGYKKCSEKYKARPQNKFVAALPRAKAIWKAGGKIQKLIGIDAGETHRKKIERDERYRYHYPLVDWDFDRSDCVRVLKRAGLPVPGKSACFFCPASTKREIIALGETHPELLERALAIEANAAAHLDTVKGLGRRFAWSEVAEESRRPLPLFDLDVEPCDSACLCFDGAAN